MGNQTTKVSSVNKNNNKYADGNDNEKKSRTNWTAGRTHNSFFRFFWNDWHFFDLPSF